MDPIRAIVDHDQYAKFLGIKLVAVGHGTATAELVIGDEHLNGLGVGHGGAIFSLADLAFAAACNSQGVPTVAINANISYLKAAKPGLLRARASEVSCDGKMASYSVHVTDAADQIIAVFQGLAYRKSPTAGHKA